ncbi:MAG: S9 family peptidase, partial [Sphingobacterium sp.]
MINLESNLTEMFKKWIYIVIIGAMLATSCVNKNGSTPVKWADATAPIAATKAYTRIIHSDTVMDEYYWLNDYFKQGPDSTSVVAYLEQENQYTATMMEDTEVLQESLFLEMKGRIKEKDESVPYLKNGYYYYRRTEEGQQYYKLCRKKGNLQSTEEVLLDVDKMAEGYSYFAVGGFSVSPDNKLLAYGVDTVSRREYTIHVKNLETGEIFADKIERTSGGSTWANDNKTLFYTSKNPVTLLSEKIMRHTLHEESQHDVVVYLEQDNTNYIGVGKSKNGAYIFIYTGGTLSSEVLILDASTPEQPFRSFQPRIKDVLYSVIPLADRFLILTNDEAKNFKVMECPLNKTGKENWKEFIPHREDVLISDVEEFKKFLVISERKNGLTQMAVRSLEDSSQHYLDFGEPAYTVYPSTNVEYDTDILRYGYTSLVTPSSTFDYSMSSMTKELMKQQEVIGGYNSELYVTERQFASAIDGSKIPISIVYKREFEKNSQAPLLLYAYGSYGSSMDPSFSSSRLSLLDRGFVYAIAHIRGGEEMGRQWYDDGKM